MNSFDEQPVPATTGRERRREVTRDAILDAAFALFHETGLRGTTIDQIATCAGINRATFYLHFKDKTGLAAGLARRLVSNGKEQYRALNDMRGPTRQQVRAWVVCYLAFVREHRTLGLMLVEAISTEPAFAQEYMDYLGRIADLRLEHFLAGETGEGRERRRSKLVLLQMMMSYSAHHIVGQELHFPGADPVDAIADIWWNELFAGQ